MSFASQSHSSIAQILREEMARRRMKRAALAAQARISLSSLEKSLAGRRPFTQQTLVRLEDVLGRRLRNSEMAREEAAPASLGGYSRRAVRSIEGEYVTIRPSFSDTTSLYVYRTQITWDTQASHLKFHEMDRIDIAYEQEGDVSIPYQTGHIYLVTNRSGQYRLTVLSRRTIQQEMLGLLTTLKAESGGQLMPVSMPVAMVPVARLGGDCRGRIDRSHPRHGELLMILRKAEINAFARHQPAPAA